LHRLKDKLDDAALEESLNSTRPYNQRIDLSLDEDGFDDADDGSLGGPDMEDDELTRDKVKRASTQILHAVNSKKRKPKKAGVGAGGGGHK
jgi:coiled-coil domain-containing protein 151